MGRFLITTADERSWKFDRPVLFLGEWCRHYRRKQIWERMDAVVARPYGLDPGQKTRDLAYTQALSNRLLAELAESLNGFHHTRHSARYWEILIGHWLRRYVDTVFNRYFTLEQALKDHEMSGTTVFDATGYSLSTNDSSGFIWATSDDVWNHVLYAHALQLSGGIAVETDPASLQGVTGFVPAGSGVTSPSPTARHAVLDVANYILTAFGRPVDAVIVGSYLPRKVELTLQLGLGQCPQLWRSPPVQRCAPRPESRRQFGIDDGAHSGFEHFVRYSIRDVIPTCYLEGYASLVAQTESLPWPAQPRFIFTSNNFDTDEVFKAWCGSKVDEGSDYFAGQHGNNYGTHFYAGNSQWPERSASDKFFSWGWSDGSAKVVPAFHFKTADKKRRHRPDGGLLLIEECLNHLITPWDTYFEYGIYQEEQFRFVAALPPPIHQALTVRIHAEYKQHVWSEDQRWADRSPHTRLQTGSGSIWDLIAQSRLLVYSYDSTGLLEALSLNIPTICFWHYGLNHLLPSARPYYELLRGAGILADSPEHAAELVTETWGRVSEWWGSKQVKAARESFCENYARSEKRPVRTMKRLLMTQGRVNDVTKREEARLL